MKCDSDSSMCAIILAGGLGTRLKSVISDVPKPMAPVSGQPFLAHLLEYLEKQKIKQIILSVGYKHQIIIDYFGKQYRSLNLTYLIENSPLGTGGALRRALKSVDKGPILALNGDTFVAMAYGPMLAAHIAANTKISIALRHVADAGRYGRVVLEQGRIIKFLEKGGAEPGWINAGIYILEPDIFAPFDLPEVFSFEQDFLQVYCSRLIPLAYPTTASFIDIGVPEDYLRIKNCLSSFLNQNG